MQNRQEIVNQVIVNSNYSSILITPLEFKHDISISKEIHWEDIEQNEIPKIIKDRIAIIREKINDINKLVKIVKKTEEPLLRIQSLRRVKNQVESLYDFFESCFGKAFQENLNSMDNKNQAARTNHEIENLKTLLNVMIDEVNDDAIYVAGMFNAIVSNKKNYSIYLEPEFQKIRDEIVKKKALSHLESIKNNEKTLNKIKNPQKLLFTSEGEDLLNDIASIEESRIEIERLRIYDLEIFKRAKNYGYTLVISQLLLISILLIILHFNSSVNLFDSSYKEGIQLIGIPITFILWSYLGCVSSLFLRLKNYMESNLGEIIKLIMVRPIQSIIITSLLFLAFKSGISIFSSNSTNTIMKSNEIISVIAFFIGFSNKFTEILLTKIYSLIGGKISDKQQIDKNIT